MSTIVVKDTISPALAVMKPAIRAEARAVMVATIEHLTGEVQRTLKTQRRIVFGKLVGSFQPRSIETDSQLTYSLTSGGVDDYAAFVEFGTKPHWPPLRPLYMWVEEKFSTAQVEVRMRGGKRTPVVQEPQFGRERSFGRAREIYRIARAVQRAIARRGTPPALYMKQAHENMGLKYTVAEAPDGTKSYVIDMLDVLRRDTTFWKRVGGRLAK